MLAGNARLTPTDSLRARVVRLLASGAVDPNFGPAGVGAPGIAMSANAIVLQKDGKIVVAGHACNGVCASNRQQFAVERYLPDGTIDTSFGERGSRLVSFDNLPGATAQAWSVVLDGDERIVLVDGARQPAPGQPDRYYGAVVRLTTTGQLDASFGQGGRALTDFMDRPGAYTAAAVLHDSSLLVVGWHEPAITGGRPYIEAALARFDASGVLRGLLFDPYAPGGIASIRPNAVALSRASTLLDSYATVVGDASLERRPGLGLARYLVR